MINKIILILCLFSFFLIRAQSVNLNQSHIENYIRLQQLNGKFDSDYSFSVRPLLQYKNGFQRNDSLLNSLIIKKWKNGDVYDGEWKNDCRDGKGNFKWANGNIYKGDWIDNKKNGKGCYTKINGD